MSILFACPSSNFGGAERYAVGMAQAAAARGHRVDFAAPDGQGAEAIFASLEGSGVTPRQLTAPPKAPSSRSEALSSTVIELHRAIGLCRAVAPDVMHLTLPYPARALGLQLAARLCGIPAVVVFQVVPEDLWISRPRRALHSRLRAQQRWIAVSEGNRRSLERVFGADPPIELVHNGVELMPPPTPDERMAARTSVAGELEVDPDSPLVLTVARLDRQKGHSDLIAALRSVRDRGQAFTAMWAGDGALRRSIAAELTEHGLASSVRLLGVRDDVRRLLAAADLFVLPSRFEGLSFALLEAMASETPTIASDATGNDTVIRDHENGLAFRTGDVPDLADKIVWALENRAEMRRMAGSARADVQSRFSHAAMVNQTMYALERPT